MSEQGSRIPGFYRLTIEARRRELSERAELSIDDLSTLDHGGLDTRTADQVVENVVGVYTLPLGVGLNFRVNGRDYLVPMAVEEPSVIAAASNAARMVREGGGFQAEADDPIMTAQVEIVGISDPEAAQGAHRARGARAAAPRARRAAAAGRARRRPARAGGAHRHRSRARHRPRAHRLPQRHGRQHGEHRRRVAGRSAGQPGAAGARACAS